MRIDEASSRPYALRLARPWVAASATMTTRYGRLVALASDGIVGFGDCAPLPSSGEKGHAETFRALDEALRALAGEELEPLSGGLGERIAQPQVRWAVETALLDLQAKQNGLPLHRLLRQNSVSEVPVNAALGRLDAGCVDRAQKAAQAGFAVAKIKVGVDPVERELEALKELVGASGDVLSFRFDANRAWAPAEAHRFLHALVKMDGLRVDGVEEPLAGPTPHALAFLQAELPFPLAADESVPVLGADALLEARAVRRLVVKPARIGGMDATLDLARRAQQAGVELVLTSVVDSAIGVMAAAHLAAALPTGQGLAHGLGTLAWLAEDVAAPPPIEMGVIRLAERPGLGLTPFDHLPGGDLFQG
ncbi:o-succinylbenzoate synthase [Afifella marina]|uniref:o-succinylbenzoate synthase n=1 Tax=Afifella marina DSM 2698 TaxID=1120955 RepID=A0A1G5MK68_AFIMA|nr:o-succinylbenzoate synthase [Afifella marina]MBK1623825.1 o-succinylbenzoate synthase [Afifella marina DSM 2698]MBK1627259.1 o-succinylbenzoate synthase [Afifella marina]MBK5918712.1 o-succinylbenzoate synthase [Afifella marina]RAI22674.1 o-succinylbenzoate synthase [Afifella marina DSM 2698]SCZ25492.1 o-succinylbenzoate synthase [Afifella marina DSM 2698]